MVGILAWILIGLIAGWLAHVILGGRGGILYNLAVGLVGAIVGGFIFSKLNIAVTQDFWGSLITATIGAVIFLAIWRAIRRA
jgi:uncharacterized membrane protein YeaQ/YmgE (transglycosylase-associated protein family)